MKKERMSLYTMLLIAIIIIVVVIALLILMLPSVKKDTSNLNIKPEEIKDISGDENIEIEGNTKTNISPRLNQIREIEEGLEASDISITTTNNKSVVAFVVTNATEETIEELKLEVRVRDNLEQDIQVLITTSQNVKSGEEKEIKIEVDADIANAKDISIRRIVTKEI